MQDRTETTHTSNVKHRRESQGQGQRAERTSWTGHARARSRRAQQQEQQHRARDRAQGAASKGRTNAWAAVVHTRTGWLAGSGHLVRGNVPQQQ